MASSNVGELQIGLSFNSSSLDKSMKSSEKNISKFGSVAQNALVTSVVQKGFDIASNAAKNFASGIIDTGKSFQKSMSNVAAISGATGSDLEALTAKAKEMGKNTVWSASEAVPAEEVSEKLNMDISHQSNNKD